MESEIERLFRSLLGQPFGPRLLGGHEACAPGSACHGYTMVVGPDGRPVVTEFGSAGAAPEGGAREPNVDTITNEKEGIAKLVVEMPGVERADIGVSVESRHVRIEAEREEKRYRVSVPLERKVDKGSAKATYKNGILEVTFRLVDEKPPGRKVEVQ